MKNARKNIMGAIWNTIFSARNLSGAMMKVLLRAIFKMRRGVGGAFRISLSILHTNGEGFSRTLRNHSLSIATETDSH